MEDAPQELHNARTHFVFFQVHTISGSISSDQTGCFPVTSKWGHVHVVIFYIFDANYIQSVPIKNRPKEELLRAYCKTYKGLVLQGFKPQLHKLDDETSHKVKAFVRSQHTHFQYTPLDMHCTPTQKNGPYKRGRISFSIRDCRAPKVLPHRQLVPTHHPIQRHPQHASPMSPKPPPIGTQSP